MQEEQAIPKDEEPVVDQNDSGPSSKNFKRIVIGAGLIILFMIFAPPLYKDKVAAIFTFASSPRLCMNYHIDSFVDPSSAYIADSYIRDKSTSLSSNPELLAYNQMIEKEFGEYEQLVTVKIFAKNRMGAYIPITVECPMKDGLIDHENKYKWLK